MSDNTTKPTSPQEDDALRELARKHAHYGHGGTGLSLCTSFDAQELEMFLKDVSAHYDQKNDGCPCLLVEPCSYACSCAKPSMSGGCQRCAKYGSLEQRKQAAKNLANVDQKITTARIDEVKKTKKMRTPGHGPRSSDYGFGYADALGHVVSGLDKRIKQLKQQATKQEKA